MTNTMQQQNFYKDSEVDKMNPPVTVLMSVYNGLPYLPEALDSILEQTFSDFEFLIIDDASTDGSGRVLAEYAERDSRIKILTNERNQGLGYSLAQGVELAQTIWIARMDADDIAVPNRLELQMSYVKDNPEVDILGGYALNINDDGQIIGERRVPICHEDIYRLLWTNPFIHATVMFRRQAILRVGSYSEKIRKRQDYELWFRCALGKLKFANLALPLIYYRFTKNTFKRNNLRQVIIPSLLIGWKGCWMVGASPIAYIGVTKPLLIGLLPPSLRPSVYDWFKVFDPRAAVKN
jgi:glycosyltransferase involved in cell wall biosynthesis